MFPLAASEYKEIKVLMLNWVSRFSIFLYLDNNDYRLPPNKFECLLGVDAATTFEGNTAAELDRLFQWHEQQKDWLFGHLSYDFKNALENRLSSRHPARISFPDLKFFCPRIVVTINSEKTALTISAIESDPEQIYREIRNTVLGPAPALPKVKFTHSFDQREYLDRIDKLRRHIRNGDCYEINFCNEGYATKTAVDPVAVFTALNKVSPAPFAAFYRLKHRYMMCASPERYLCKTGTEVTAQPIKGTAGRDPDPDQDRARSEALRNSSKDRAENVMIVDLMRNDLARTCDPGSIKVDELFGIYSFPQVHQMISTISGRLRRDVPFTDAIRYSFPMGSMTGAPKIKVMELIDTYEKSRRELFSGTVGYITPEGDFDFNVIIRSLFYNQETSYLSYQTGGAITFDSDPQLEWEEMRLKAWALEKIFASD